MNKQTKYNKKWSEKQLKKGLCMWCNNPKLKHQKKCSKCYVRICAQNALNNGKLGEEVLGLLFAQNFKCFYSGRNIELGLNAQIDHIMSKSKYPNKITDLENIVWCHEDINRMKNNFDKEYFIQTCKEIAKHNM
jgi:5-methylcytosine-specific restriction endonuclease McrA